MRIASFNIENFFLRARAMNLATWADGKEILNKYTQLNRLLQKLKYSATDKKQILKLIDKLGLNKSDKSEFVELRQNKGKLLKRPKSAPPEIVADGRDSWIGWLELRTEAVDETATQITAKVIKDVNADILSVIEAEDRTALKNFNKQLLEPTNAEYNYIMLIDGNDERGIDVGLLTKPGFNIGPIVSHVDDMDNGSTIFSRDCPEYTVKVSDATSILLMVNHLKSKGYGVQSASNERRKKQAKRVREIYEMRKAQGIELIAVTGDFNDTPDSDPLSPLLADGSDLKDIFKHENFDDGGRPGTFGNCSESQKIDYILLSPKLYEKVTTGGVWRKGVWGGKNGTIFPHYDEITKPIQSASDHAAVWVDLEL